VRGVTRQTGKREELQLNHPAQRISLFSASAFLNSTRTLGPRLRTPARLQHHTQDAVDAEPGVPEAGVGVVHFPFGSARS